MNLQTTYHTTLAPLNKRAFALFLAFIGLLFAPPLISAQRYNPNVPQALSEINDPVGVVRKLESFGLKSVGSESSFQTLQWLIQQYQSYGYDSVRVDSFKRNEKMYRNLVVTKSGAGNEYLIVCGHYDTRGGAGASDNGSGVAAILETARVLSGLATERNVVFIHFDGEEEGFIGSQYYVDHQLASLGNLSLVFNVDQIGGTKGETGNDKIKCERDENDIPYTNNILSARVTDTIANLCKLYTSLEPVISRAYSSDYVPFEEKGNVITGIYQNAADLYSHRVADSVGNMDTTSFKQAVRLTAATTIHFARVSKFVSVQEVSHEALGIYPNPASDYLNLPLDQGIDGNVRIVNTLGQIFQKEIDPTGRILVSDLTPGVYTLLVKKKEVTQSQVVIITRD